MVAPIRWTSSGRLVRVLELLSIGMVATVLAACQAESPSIADSKTTPSLEPSPNTSTACSPEVGGLTSAPLSPIDIRCPPGQEARDTTKGLPITGRFSTEEELVAAFCAPSRIVELVASPPQVSTVDFNLFDVVAYPFDANVGQPSLFLRGEEIWLRTTNDTCSGTEPSLTSIAFAIPKRVNINKQSCSLACAP